MPALNISHASCVYTGGTTPSVSEVSLHVDDGEFLTLIGHTGSGKSTLLRMIAGLEETTSGSLSIDHRDVTSLPPKHRDVSMIFQNYALYPQMSVAENMGFALKVAGLSRGERETRVAEVAAGLGLSEYLDAAPSTLTGRQRQRVAVGRALARIPSILLLDEPFSGLPRDERRDLVHRIRHLADRLGITTIYATRDLPDDEFAGRVAVIARGRMRQVAPLAALRAEPADLDVARAISAEPLTHWTAPLDESGNLALDGQLRHIGDGSRLVALTVPQQRVRLTARSTGLPGIVEHIDTLEDATQRLVVRIVDRDRSECVVNAPALEHQIGDKIWLDVDLREVTVFDAETGRLLATPGSDTTVAEPRER